MTERFNSGAGGYTCDGCSKLLWAGVGGLKNPSKRRFWYRETEESILVLDVWDKAYCGKCSETVKPKLNSNKD